MLIDRGFDKVRPLAGGLDAWFEAGYDSETLAPSAAGKTQP
jgi:rhodanese-related sulfurtransferase